MKKQETKEDQKLAEKAQKILERIQQGKEKTIPWNLMKSRLKQSEDRGQ